MARCIVPHSRKPAWPLPCRAPTRVVGAAAPDVARGVHQAGHVEEGDRGHRPGPHQGGHAAELVGDNGADHELDQVARGQKKPGGGGETRWVARGKKVKGEGGRGARVQWTLPLLWLAPVSNTKTPEPQLNAQPLRQNTRQNPTPAIPPTCRRTGCRGRGSSRTRRCSTRCP